MLSKLKEELHDLANEEKAACSAWFFKTGKGEYGESDKFLGISVPDQRKLAKRYKEFSLEDIQSLLGSEYHEFRLTALFILILKFEKADEDKKKEIYDFYLKNSFRINNWDLVDSSAHKNVGAYLIDKDKKILFTLAKSKNLWERRISVISTFHFIKYLQYENSLNIAQILLNDKHDLIHKAVGWMLREIGKRNQNVEEEFLEKYYKIMPRTMLRSAIERFSKEKKEYFMKR